MVKEYGKKEAGAKSDGGINIIFFQEWC